jgi:imidazolonepropionase-like amidohydrolase
MHRARLAFLTLLCLHLCLVSNAQPPSPAQPPNPKLIAIKAAHMLDVKTGHTLENPVIVIEDDRIQAVGSSIAIPASAEVIDLGNVTLLPGLIDCHTHLMARIPAGPNGYGVNLLTKSQAFRALEGAADARLTLHAGFTTVRDVESEGSGYADTALRDAINQGLVEGPRMQVATRAIAALGQYEPFGISPDLEDFPTGAQLVSGPEEARRAAREQIGHGADLIKVYADWQHPTLTVEEMRVVVEEAHRAGLKVAAHATTVDGIRNALTAGVDSIEHGSLADPSSIQLMKEKNAYWVPTVGHAFFTQDTITNPRSRKYVQSVLDATRQNIPIARQLGVKIANGFDPESAETHGKNAQEIVAMSRLGLTPLEAIQSATITSSELLGWQDRIGTLEPGKFADIIAVRNDPLADITQLQNVLWVMKGGTVVKNELQPTLLH